MRKAQKSVLAKPLVLIYDKKISSVASSSEVQVVDIVPLL